MYEQHFALKKRPFRSNATGSDVFVGPQSAKTLAGVIKALSSCDAIVTVSGPVGVGKTALVARALDSIGKTRKIVCVGRMQLNSSDVLELLLEELGLRNLPHGTIQKFGAFRRRLKALEDAGTRVLIVIEDGIRIGTDALAELEALTAVDAGESAGASIVVMGDERLDKNLKGPQLARFLQRVRRRQSVAPLCVAELRGYLMHCLRVAGGDFASLFEADAADLLHQLSNGIPRIANNLVDSALSAAADVGAEKVTTRMLLQTAEAEYGLSVSAAISTPPVVRQPVATAEPVVAKAEPVVAKAKPAVRKPQPPQEEIAIPELIQDTLPDLEILKPPLAAAAVVPAWDRDPTLAELKPDLAALEQAMAFAQGGEPDAAESQAQSVAPAVEEPAAEEIPEITLDHAISRKIASNLIDEPGEISPPESENIAEAPVDPDGPKVGLPPQKNKPAKPEMDQIAVELAKAKTIEDVDDKMAETLFGDELNFAAAQVRAAVAASELVNDDDQADENEAASIAKENGSAPVEVTLEATKSSDDGGLDPSASQRLKTVRALNDAVHPALHVAKGQPAANTVAVTPAAVETPMSIEDQINTSLTQTLKALNVEAPISHDEDENDDDTKSGFLSRFKRS